MAHPAPVLIIAEAGVNHNGRLDLAERLVDAAAAAGADFVKFQTFKAESLVTPDASKARYQVENTGDAGSQFAMLKALELSPEAHRALRARCQAKGIRFLSTPFDEDSADFLEPMVSLYKVSSGDLTNHPFLAHLARKGKPLIVSTGMSELDEVAEAVRAVKAAWKEAGVDGESPRRLEGLTLPMLQLLHCTTAYPTPFADVNLKAMKALEALAPAGYSDHTPGIEVACAAAALGARVIEKHFTLDRALEGPDHKASLTPEELAALVTGVRRVEAALGDGVKRPTAGERETREVARKSVVYRRDLRAGHALGAADLGLKRPGSGLPPARLAGLLGRRLARDVRKDQLAAEGDLGA